MRAKARELEHRFPLFSIDEDQVWPYVAVAEILPLSLQWMIVVGGRKGKVFHKEFDEEF